jgi:hypothetical protein
MRELIQQQDLQIVTKIIRDQSGAEFLACFAVTNINGELCFRLMSLRPAEAKVGKTETVLLTGDLSIPSPYVSKTIRVETREPAYKELSFVLSQPTRAPNFVN